jgi:TonB family protein
MPTTANEAAPATPSALPGPENSVDAAHSARRTDAVGAEIAVTIHASRYSSNRGTTNKNLPPVHEETRTVIIFPTGAVVRLSASVTTGELVVLTNQQTGDDVICRVANVKAQTGSQNYVNLEFTQRAPSFWGDAIQSGRANRSDSAKVAVPATVIPQMAPPENNRVQPEHVAAAQPAKREPISVPSAELMSAVQAVTDLLNSVPGPTRAPSRLETSAAQLPTVFEEEGSEQEASEREDSGEEPLFDEEPEEEVLFDAEHEPEIAPAPATMLATAPSKIMVANDVQPQLQPQAQLQVVPAMVVKAPAVTPSLPAPILTIADLKIADLKTNSTLEAASRALTKATPDSNPKAERLQGIGTIGDSSDNAKPGTPFGSAGELSFSKAMQNDAQEWAKPSALPSQLDKKAPSSKKILLIAAAAIVLLILGGAGGAVLFRQSRPAPEQPPAVATVPATTQSSLMGGTVVTAATTSPVIAQPASSPVRAASADGDAASQPAKASPSADSSTRRPSIRVGKLAAPVTRAATSVVSSEPPPDLVAPAVLGNLVDNNLLASAGRANEPMAPVAGPSHAGGQLQQPKLISAPPASYPPLALRARMQGVVVIDALVDTNGKVTAMKVISGLADLQQAAMEAVHNWKYEPAQLNGQPIAVHTKVNVAFHLQ